MVESNMDMMKLMEQFGTEDKCRAILEELRWPDGTRCPRCNSVKTSRIHARDQFDCDTCRHQFSVTSGTIWHDTHLPLRKWFIAIYLTVESKKGMSANQMKRVLGVSYKTAWYLCHRIRAAMTEHAAAPLNGTVEVDETFIGGKLKGQGRGRGASLKNKAIVIGVIQRGGKVRLQVIDRTDRKTLHQFIKDHTAPDTEVIITDDWRPYRGIGDADTKHEIINHSAKEHVRGDIHTNGIENVWSLLKRSVTGTYHKLSVKHLDAYLDELEWRFNNRDNSYLFRDTLIKLICSANLEYKNLTAKGCDAA
jgi:transposase-like protein